MIYNNRTYPHPVLGLNDDFIDSDISVQLSFSTNKDYVEIRPIFTITNEDIKLLIAQTNAYYVSHIYCRGTMFREVFKTSKNLSDPIRIESDKLNGEVEIDFFICADNNLKKYSSASFNSDYESKKFELDKADIIAYGGKGKFHANKTPEQLKAVSSIMSIICTGKHDKPMSIDYSGSRVAIQLCIEDYNNYKLLKTNKEHYTIILNTIVLPALIEALYCIDIEEAQEFSERPWFKLLKEIKDAASDNNLVLAQNILGKPISKCLETLINNPENE